MASATKAATVPLKVFVKPGSKAERICRSRAGKGRVSTRPTRDRAAAAGFPPHPELDLHDHGGKILPDLVFTNFYVGGSGGWNQSDIQSIDSALSAAMSDRGLNNVMVQYNRGAPITSTFKPSTVLPAPGANTMSQQDVEALVSSLQSAGKLNGFDFGSTVFNFMLPRGMVLTIDDGGGDEGGQQGHSRGEVEDKVSSLEGLGGFHGSVHIGSDILYYAVGVFSEGNNGIVAFDQSWKNVVATFYHELNEARTDAGVEDDAVAWVNDESPSEEIGDIPMSLAGSDLSLVMKEVQLADGSGTVPIQLMWSNAVHAPEGPIPAPH